MRLGWITARGPLFLAETDEGLVVTPIRTKSNTSTPGATDFTPDNAFLIQERLVAAGFKRLVEDL